MLFIKCFEILRIISKRKKVSLFRKTFLTFKAHKVTLFNILPMKNLYYVFVKGLIQWYMVFLLQTWRN